MGGVGAAIGVAGRVTAASAQTRGRPAADAGSPRALVFDVFGTVVDWRGSVAREVEAVAKQKNLRVDGTKFADAWRAQYGPSMSRVRKGELPWTKLDDLHRLVVDQLLPEYGLTDLSEPEIVNLNRAWHRLDPWPDAVQGLTRLKRKYVIAPLSNGNIALMTNLAKHAGLPWIAFSGPNWCGTTNLIPRCIARRLTFLACDSPRS
jgi:2-haloacid dehalogenase